MKFWFDVTTPKQVNFFKPVVDELRRRKHDVLCTSRNYREVVELAKIKGLDLVIVGEHGGDSLYGKLKASVARTQNLIDLVQEFAPDCLVSLSSPEASRVAFGLGIRYVGFNDAPHAEAVCRLTIPLMDTLLCPSIIPVREFTRYGISKKQIIRYRAIDPAMWLKDGVKQIYKPEDLHLDPSKNTISFRFEESYAAYLLKIDRLGSLNFLRSLVSSFKDCNIVILSRYEEQIKTVKEFADETIIIKDVIDGTSLLMLSDVFVGSGGTMNWEASLLGIPNISFASRKYLINEYFIKKGLSKKCKDANQLVRLTRYMLNDADYKRRLKIKAKTMLSQMDDIKEKTIKVLLKEDRKS